MGVIKLDILVTSSPKTLGWLNFIKSNVIKEISSMKYIEAKYCASFKSHDTKRNVVYLRPSKNQIRLFTELPLSFDNKLESTSSSSIWAEMYPSVFKIRSEHEIEKAVYLIINSYRLDLTKKSLTKG